MNGPNDTNRPPPLRLVFLDGMRALAAWFVVVHHIWIESFPGFPGNAGPWVVGWMRWGHLAVAVFIVLSGFSLILGPARHGDRAVDGNAEFFRRRTRRILPPYWVALAISMLVIVAYTGQYSGQFVNLKTALVYGLLLQDIVSAPSPNGAFWSIAVEWHIYFAFPLILWTIRRWGQTAMLVLTTGAVVLAYLLGTGVGGLFEKLLHFTPQFLALFALGVFAGRAMLDRPAPDAASRRRTGLLTAVVTGAMVLVLALGDPGTLVDQFFWLDIVFGSVAALACYALATGSLPSVARVLGSRPLVFVGMFSYSTYLIHFPVLSVVKHAVAEPLGATQLERFLILGGVALPAIAVCSYLFFLAFERPFLGRGVKRRAARPSRQDAPTPAQPLTPAQPPMPALPLTPDADRAPDAAHQGPDRDRGVTPRG